MSRPSHGFRFAPLDGVALALAAAVTPLAWTQAGTYAWIVPAAVLHFFAFSNVFRVRPSWQLLWAGVFLVNFGTWIMLDCFSWLGVLGVQAPLTVSLVAMEMRSPHYHGVGAKHLNPDLDAYLTAKAR